MAEVKVEGLGERLREAREAKGYTTPERAAIRAGLGAATLRRIEAWMDANF